MDSSDKGFSTTPIKPSANPKFPSPYTGGADENDMNYNKMDAKFKKPLTKHFMPPTISAASKVAVPFPRNKILVERNDASAFADTRLQNVPNHDSKTNPVNFGRSSRYSSGVIPSYSRAHESYDDDDDEQNPLVADSALKPYDPLMNYLSPRPKFLRYKPNRRRDLFLHRGNEIREASGSFGVKTSVSFDSQKVNVEDDSSAHGSSASSSQECSAEQENEDLGKSECDDEEEEEFEGFDNQRVCSLKRVLEFLLVIVALFLSTLYISSMNSPAPSPTLQAIYDLKDGYNRIQNNVFEVVSLNILEGGSESFAPREEETQVGHPEMDNREDDGFEKEVMVRDDNMVLVEGTDELGEVVELQSGDVSDDEMEKTEIGTSEVEYDHELEDKSKGSDHSEEKCAAYGENHEPYMAELVDYRDFDLSGSEKDLNVNCAGEEVEIEDQAKPVDGVFDEAARNQVVENENYEMERVEDIFTNNAGDEIVTQERRDSGSTNSETINPEMGLIKHLETEMFPVGVIGFCLFVMFPASLVLGFQLRHKKSYVNDSLLTEKLPSEPLIAEKISPVIPEREDGQIEKVESFVRSLIRSVDEAASQEIYQCHAPTVELIGEFVVREFSSSLKSCGMKSKMMETEKSNNSVSQGQGSWHKARVFSSQAQPSALESSSVEPPLYGSFTAEKEIVKKKEGKDGEVRMVVTTPVRRSSRIRMMSA